MGTAVKIIYKKKVENKASSNEIDNQDIQEQKTDDVI